MHLLNRSCFDAYMASSYRSKCERECRGLQVDVSGFTRLSEAFSSLGKEGCEEFSLIMSRFLARMCKIIHEHGGDIDCFAGDALLVAFSQPNEKAINGGDGVDGEVGRDMEPDDAGLHNPPSTPQTMRSQKPLNDVTLSDVSRSSWRRSRKVRPSRISFGDDHGLMMRESVTSAVACAMAICRELNGFRASENHPPLGIHASLSAGTVHAVECGKDAVYIRRLARLDLSFIMHVRNSLYTLLSSGHLLCMTK